MHTPFGNPGTFRTRDTVGALGRDDGLVGCLFPFPLLLHFRKNRNANSHIDCLRLCVFVANFLPLTRHGCMVTLRICSVFLCVRASFILPLHTQRKGASSASGLWGNLWAEAQATLPDIPMPFFRHVAVTPRTTDTRLLPNGAVVQTCS